MKWNKLFWLLSVALLLSALVLTGCTGAGDPTETVPGTGDATQPVTDGAVTTGAGQPDDIPVAEGRLSLVNGSNVAHVVVPPRCTDSIKDYATTVATMLSKKSGTKVSVETADATKYDADAVEILIGNVGYPEVEAVRSRLSLGSWNLSVEGNKVVVYAFSESWYSGAIQSLVKAVFMQEVGNVTVAKDLSETKIMNPLLEISPRVDGYIADSFNITGVGDTCIDLFYENKNASDFDAFCTALKTQGWAEYASHQIGNNKYATYTNESHVLNISILPYCNRMTVALESREDTDLQGVKSDNVYGSKGYDSTVTQLGMWIGYSAGDRWDAWINGLGHVIRLEDGSFIIIDGGHDRTINEAQLYNTLAIQAPDPNNIVIAAWIFTHPHGDHTGAFSLFDHANVTVEQFIIHLPSTKAEATAGGGTSNSTYMRIRSKYPNAKVVTAHPGQMFYIRNAEIEMLWTLDMLYENDFVEVNAASLCFNLYLNGHKILYLGDQTNAETNKMIKAFGTELRAESMLAPHHAFNGTALLWAMVGPQYVWCPSGSEWQFNQGLGKQNGNDYFWGNEKITTWFAAEHIWVVTLAKDTAPSAQYYENIAAYYTAMQFTPNS